MKYKLTLLALLIPTAVFAQSSGETRAANFYNQSNPGQQAGYNNTARAAGQGPNNVTPYSVGNVYLNAGLWGSAASGIGYGVKAATPGTTSAANTVASGTTSTANSAASGASSTANSAASGASSATNSAVSGASSAGNTVKGWF